MQGQGRYDLLCPVEGMLQVVAIGDVVIDPNVPAVLHGLPLPAGSVKVSIVTPKVQNALLSYLVDDATTVGEGVGHFIAWPMRWMMQHTVMVCISLNFKF